MSKFNKIKRKNDKLMALIDLQADDDELIEHLRKLISERDKLAQKIMSVNNEADTLKEILLCTSKEDLKHVYEEFYITESSDCDMTPEEVNLVRQRFSFLYNYNFQCYCGVSIRVGEEGDIILCFSPPPHYTPPEMSVLKFQRKERKKLKLKGHLLPPVVPVNDLEDEYMKDKSQDLPAFIHAIQQSLVCYWVRDIYVSSIKKEEYMKNTLIYFNRGRTFISFTLMFMDQFKVEFSLNYDIFSVLPHDVEYSEWQDKRFPDQLLIALEETKDTLLKFSLPLVLRVNLGSESAAGSEGNSEATSTSWLALEF